ncbi:MAG: C4-dicarboxylic acid transporter DauA [Deltaproteobacteria bacterium]|nr:C4-dicarboxylic acid transporter DauA [Deltaproteobacteria bacterium]
MLKRLRQRYESTISTLDVGARPAAALREALAEGYGLAKLRDDVMAGLVVGVVALPLSMALGIASGAPPQHGLYTAIVAGILSAALGGSRTQVSGPTAAFVVILAPICAEHGLGGLLVASMMAGFILIGLGIARMGQLIQWIPHPVTTGFTAGIGMVIATLQLKDFLGLDTGPMPDHYIERVGALAQALPTLSLPDLGIGALTLFVLLYWPRITTRVPAPLLALGLASVAAAASGVDVATIGSRFSHEGGRGIPQGLPVPVLPWSFAGADGAALTMDFALVRELFPSAFAIAMLGAIESLLSAVVADGMVGTRHDPNAELLAQGASNIAAPFLGGFASTGAIARTATNIRAGGRSPVAAITHGIFVAVAMLSLAPLLSYLPMAALAALLLVVAWNMSDIKHFRHVLRVAPKSDVTVLLACFGLTVLFDMVIAVTTGIMLAALLFMRRMAEISGARVVEGRHAALREPLPEGVVLYEIAGPLFFGAAQKAMGALETVADRARVVILDMHGVPAMDATGLVGLESALDVLDAAGTFVILCDVQAQPQKVLEKSGIQETPRLAFCTNLDTAVARAKARVRGG